MYLCLLLFYVLNVFASHVDHVCLLHVFQQKMEVGKKSNDGIYHNLFSFSFGLCVAFS